MGSYVPKIAVVTNYIAYISSCEFPTKSVYRVVVWKNLHVTWWRTWLVCRVHQWMIHHWERRNCADRNLRPVVQTGVVLTASWASSLSRRKSDGWSQDWRNAISVIVKPCGILNKIRWYVLRFCVWKLKWCILVVQIIFWRLVICILLKCYLYFGEEREERILTLLFNWVAG